MDVVRKFIILPLTTFLDRWVAELCSCYVPAFALVSPGPSRMETVRARTREISGTEGYEVKTKRGTWSRGART
ncbi:hypothetical protein B0T26DRAFT_711148 [Lasiosphaeria miniovina]|uniref:Uncharacterized protein n=1 Tax=Lasiosphaeria miniovina TaxID=1954250 RepID=A0AA40ALF2_9PEZI|nr:uncharacterized protein B0T26DRAFT_711148 [Lasiosphaeria miniovina]KAK0717882.1 hypothetical protein B0T26DRAFT_711148 [Lasiosphaeria miniovina]